MVSGGDKASEMRRLLSCLRWGYVDQPAGTEPFESCNNRFICVGQRLPLFSLRRIDRIIASLFHWEKMK